MSIEKLLNEVRTSSDKDDYCVICYKDQYEQTRELFPNEKFMSFKKSTLVII